MGTKLETTHIIYVFGLHRENHVLNKENHHQCQYSSLLMWSVFILQQTWRSFWLSRTIQTPTFNTSCQNQQCIVEIKILAVRTKAESLQTKSFQKKTWLKCIIIQAFWNSGAFSSHNFLSPDLFLNFLFFCTCAVIWFSVMDRHSDWVIWASGAFYTPPNSGRRETRFQIVE